MHPQHIVVASFSIRNWTPHVPCQHHGSDDNLCIWPSEFTLQWLRWLPKLKKFLPS